MPAKSARLTAVTSTAWHFCLAIHLSLIVAYLGGTPATAQYQREGNRSKRFGPETCGPADPNYIRIANETGGLPLFLQPEEAAKAVRQTGETVLWATGTLEGGGQEFTVPLDSTLVSATFSLSVDTKGSSMAVVRPSGAEVAPGDAGAAITELNCGRFVTISSPQAGNWRVRITGSGRFWIEALARTEIFLVSVKFVKPGGRPGHEGLFKISGQPVAGEPAMLRVDLSGPLRSAEFKLVSEGGETIKPIATTGETSGSDVHEFLATFELPAQPFRIAATGLDSNGNPYQRFFPGLFHAETVEVVPAGRLDSLPPGKTTLVTFTVRNAGPAATFRIIVADSLRLVSRVDPEELALAPGASGTVTATVTVPADTTPGTGVNLTITATSTSGPVTTNGTSVHLSVFPSELP